LASACAASALLVRVPALTGAPLPLRWVVVLAIATGVLVATHRGLARLLPLAALLELSVQFPGPAPSRYVIARDAGNPRKLREIVARAQRGDLLVNLVDAEAARDILALVAALRAHDSQTRGRAQQDGQAGRVGLAADPRASRGRGAPHHASQRVVGRLGRHDRAAS
jgi:hypothetical protein